MSATKTPGVRQILERFSSSKPKRADKAALRANRSRFLRFVECRTDTFKCFVLCHFDISVIAGIEAKRVREEAKRVREEAKRVREPPGHFKIVFVSCTKLCHRVLVPKVGRAAMRGQFPQGRSRRPCRIRTDDCSPALARRMTRKAACSGERASNVVHNEAQNIGGLSDRPVIFSCLRPTRTSPDAGATGCRWSGLCVPLWSVLCRDPRRASAISRRRPAARLCSHIFFARPFFMSCWPSAERECDQPCRPAPTPDRRRVTLSPDCRLLPMLTGGARRSSTFVSGKFVVLGIFAQRFWRKLCESGNRVGCHGNPPCDGELVAKRRVPSVRSKRPQGRGWPLRQRDRCCGPPVLNDGEANAHRN